MKITDGATDIIAIAIESAFVGAIAVLAIRDIISTIATPILKQEDQNTMRGSAAKKNITTHLDVIFALAKKAGKIALDILLVVGLGLVVAVHLSLGGHFNRFIEDRA